jgi:tRNA (guanine10-N2)-dimethyltransferase
VDRLFFLLSGEHETLPSSEIKAILEAEGYNYTNFSKLDQVLRLETDKTAVEAIKSRAALTRLCAKELSNCKNNENDIMDCIKKVDFEPILKDNSTFAVRIKRVKDYGSKNDVMGYERKLGKLILAQSKKAKVSLRNPEITFRGVLTGNELVFGLQLAEIPAKPFVERRPRKKPFFHPAAMSSKLSRVMVNLTQTKKGEILLDPFCGTGSMLIEAALIGCQAFGLDVQRRMVRGTLRNMRHFNLEFEGLVLSDVRKLPASRIDCVATDPPYGRSTITLKRTTGQLIEEMFRAVHQMLRKGKRICIAAPKTSNIGAIGENVGFRHLESHLVYVHRSLTREVAVFEKM